MVTQHHQLSGHEFKQTPGDSEGQGSLVCCSPWSCKGSDTTEQLNNNNRVVSALQRTCSISSSCCFSQAVEDVLTLPTLQPGSVRTRPNGCTTTLPPIVNMSLPTQRNGRGTQCVYPLSQIAKADITRKHRRLGDLNAETYSTWFWMLKVQDQGASRPCVW